jgi:hypothetical protein
MTEAQPKVVKKIYAVFYSPGTFVSESSEREVSNADPAEAVRIAGGIKERYNAMPFGFRFETRLVAGDIDDGLGGKLKVQPRTLETSGMHYINGTPETLDQVRERADPRESILLSNMEGNSMPIVVSGCSPYKWTHEFTADSVVVNAAGIIIERGDDPKHVKYREETLARVRLERGY